MIGYSIIITFVILIFSAIVHEVMHGVVAEKLGDSTARDMGRITLNPIPHIDLYGTILLPLLIYFGSGGRFWFGAAKPVPVNFDNLHPKRLGMALVSLAGPFSNFVLAVICALIIKVDLANSVAYPILIQAIIINLLLGVFNLIPIPPLDGSKVIASMLPERWIYQLFRFERWGFIIILILLYIGALDFILGPVLLGFWQIFHLNMNDLMSVLGG